MRILVISQYFWPESFRINDLCLGLRDMGHEVVVLTGKPNYPQGKFYKGYSFFSRRKEQWEGLHIHRTPLISRGKGGGIRLFINYFSFAFFASVRVLFIRNSFDKIFVYEPSPITVGIPAIVAKYRFKAGVIFWVQDLWPESIAAAGGVKNRFVLQLIDQLTRFIYHQSKFILMQSRAFKSYILKQGIPDHKLIYFPNSTENYYKVQERRSEYEVKLPAGFRLMFAGNIGKSQSFETLLEAARMLKEENIDVKWVIIGDGRMREYVEAKVKALNLSDTFFLLGSYPSTTMPYFFSCSDALLASLQKDNIFAMTIPSKVQSYMACSKPIIGSLDGEGAKIIVEANAGFVAETENPASLAECVKRMIACTEHERKQMGQNGRNYFEREFDRSKLLHKLEGIFQKE